MLPLAYFPTKVIFIDDSEYYVKVLLDRLASDKRELVGFTEAKHGIDYLNSHYKSDHYLRRYITQIDEEQFEHRAFDIAIYDIHKEIYNKSRFKQISTLVVDYSMPYINGLDLCKAIKDPNIQKILLTGIADEQIAVQAFNDGIINKFFKKSDLNLAEKLEIALEKAQQNYFNIISSEVQKLIINNDRRSTALSDPAFQELLKKIIKDFDIVEYYIVESIGSYLLVDSKGYNYGLFVADDEVMDAMAQEAFYPESKASAKVVRLIQNREKMLCYHNKYSVALPHVDLWEDYLYPVNKLERKKTFYWALVPQKIDIFAKNLTTYQMYQKEHGECSLNGNQFY